MSLTLYAMSDEYKHLQDNIIDDETGEINESSIKRLNELKEPIDKKCLNIVRMMKSWNAEYEAIKQERQAMQAREKALKAKSDWANNYLLANMEKTGIHQISCEQFVIKLKKNPCSVDVYDSEKIPQEFWHMKMEYSTQEIKDAIKSGVEVPGARLVQNNRIDIK